MLCVLRIQDNNNGYITLDTSNDNHHFQDKDTKLKITHAINDKSIFIFSKFRSDSNLAKFTNVYQDKFYNYTTHTNKIDRYLNIKNINNEWKILLTDQHAFFPLENNNENYYIDMSYDKLPNIEFIPYYKYASFMKTLHNREIGLKSYISKTKPIFKKRYNSKTLH